VYIRSLVALYLQDLTHGQTGFGGGQEKFCHRAVFWLTIGTPYRLSTGSRVSPIV
jgi:hypothetical protein